MKQVLRFPRLKLNDVKHGSTLKIMEKLVEDLNKGKRKKKGSDSEERRTPDISLLDDSVFSESEVFVPSGIVPLDCITCYGLGWPCGIIEIYGPESSGKSAILELTLAEAQRRGYFTGLFPMEYSMNMRRAVSVGINPKRLFVFDECETVEDVFEQIKRTVKQIRKIDKDMPIVFGWDTIAATPTRTEQKHPKGLEASDMGKMAQQMSKFFRRIVKFLMVNRVCLLCINQTRTNLAQMWGSKETTYGGRALRFYAWIRIRVRQEKIIKDKDDKEIGFLCRAKAVKNKAGRPFGECIIPVYSGQGIDPVRAVWEYAIEEDIIHRHGSHYSYHGHVMTRKVFPKYYDKRKAQFDERLRRHSQGRD